MATTNLDCLVALRAEIDAALAAVNEPLAGLHDLARVSLSDAALAEVNNSIESHNRRSDQLSNVLAQLNDLENALRDLTHDGYPAMPPEPVSGEVYQELLQQQADLEKAFQQFAAEVAAQIAANLGTPTDKPVI